MKFYDVYVRHIEAETGVYKICDWKQLQQLIDLFKDEPQYEIKFIVLD